MEASPDSSDTIPTVIFLAMAKPDEGGVGGDKSGESQFSSVPESSSATAKKKGFSFQTNCGGLSGYVNTFEIGREKQSKLSKNLHMEHWHFGVKG